MIKQRAEEIAQSPDMKNVSYNGNQVYIQHVNEHSDTARVFNLDNPQHEYDAQLSRLYEK
ncbi:small acid-soluble spore protein H (minor) [Oceanobacillus limi]|uniref:Small, acid-soluble spore protein H n=1 Tax=Oceanobacillus limi TaxID=930131 RepID=A0A1I0CPS7_9BACI|nr:H-type small acid-soluble spore protein [Oceanobacillus limi]SET21230.1 small acid-soluble spore protein H (minor) [Oceanobacillus limi]